MSQTDKTLLEQMRISDVEINRRKALLDFTESDVQALVSCSELIEDEIDSLVNRFYIQQTSIEEISLLIGDADTLQRLRVAQKRYVLSLFHGNYDIQYVNDRLRIGMVHKRIGVEPKLYLSAVKFLKEVITDVLVSAIPEKERVANVLVALDKLLYFDTTLVVDTYIRSLLNEVEVAKDRVSVYARDLEQRVEERTRQIAELSRRDPLTGLFNRRALSESLTRELQQAKRHRRVMSVVYFDIDEFKKVNDTRGHIVGDEILRQIGGLLLKRARVIDFPCRWGGDEFCLVMPDCDKTQAEIAMQRFIDEFSLIGLGVSFSVGVVQVGPEVFLEPDEVIRQADLKMYTSKAKSGFALTS